MNAVAFFAESQPACAERIVLPAGDHYSRVVVGRILKPADHLELASRTGAHISTHRNLKRGDNDSVLDNRQLAVDQADQDNSIAVFVAVGPFSSRILGANR